jgi:hypothetical protein
MYVNWSSGLYDYAKSQEDIEKALNAQNEENKLKEEKHWEESLNPALDLTQVD